MSYPPLIQFETRAREAGAKARLARELRAARPPRSRSIRWLPFLRLRTRIESAPRAAAAPGRP